MKPSPEELDKALRYHAARLLKSADCPCPTCEREALPTRIVLGVLGWAAGRPVASGMRHSFAEHLADLYEREDLAALTRDPRMAEIITGYTPPSTWSRPMKCPRCGRDMPIGTAHGPGAGQYECRGCNVYVPITPRREPCPAQPAITR